MIDSAPVPAPVSDRRLTLISLVLALGAFITLLDSTIINVALDRLRSVFDASVADTQWVTTAYLLAFVAVIPFSGWLSERVGAHRAWLFAIAAFLAGSILCGLATSLPVLIGFRALQGIGGGMVMPITMSIVARAAGPERMHRATAAVALPGLLGPILGSVLGGAIVQYWNWHWLFYVNVPVCVVALALGSFLLPKTPGRRGHRFDIRGFLLLTPGVVALAYGVAQATGADGFADPKAWVPLAAGVSLLAGFTLYALTTGNQPLIDVRIFARRSFGAGSLVTFMAGFSTYALMFLLPLYYQQVRGESVFRTGLLLIPQGLGVLFFIIALRNLAARSDGRIVVVGGVASTMIGILPFALADASGGTGLLLLGQFAQGLGFAASTFPVLTLALAGLSHDETPRGSAAFSVVQRVGAPFGVAVIAVILQNLLTGSTSPAAAFSETFWWTFGFGALPLALAFLLPGRTSAGQPTSAPD
jgi:EmrB/QacA subfamily drug resistance transporter